MSEKFRKRVHLGIREFPNELSQKLNTAKNYFLRDHILKEGQIEVTVIEKEEKSGEAIEKMENHNL
jgi:iron-sulfur cluster repair protein YtfE (RIC family)